MTHDQNFETILQESLQRFGLGENLDSETDLFALGLNSLDIVNLLVTLESAYAVRFPITSLDPLSFRTPASIWRVLTELSAKQ
ncbi:phosphopantetheine-binding protein [Nocardia sp. NPDC060249]|uniref:phosphopantetheine-binding protein n=1 Tax=Nocardia sp. NPDC060249 TaxID=3347082 RepID=UPI00365F3092